MSIDKEKTDTETESILDLHYQNEKNTYETALKSAIQKMNLDQIFPDRSDNYTHF